MLTDDSDASGWQLYSSVHLLAADGDEEMTHKFSPREFPVIIGWVRGQTTLNATS